MFRKLIPYVAALSMLPAVAYSQDKTKESKPTGQVSMEVSGEAPWYNVRGPRVSFDSTSDAGKLSVVYVPFSKKYESVHDAHIIWELPVKKIGLKPVFENTQHGAGGGATVTMPFSSVQLAVRGEFFKDRRYGEAKFLSKHVDLDFGAKDEKGNVQAYGYATANFGRHDDTFTMGFAPGYASDSSASHILWNNFSFDRDEWGIFSTNYYQPGTGDWTVEVFSGINDITKFWYDRFVDRLVASNDINPKERSYILAFPSYLTFGEWSAELRADHTDGRSFVNLGAGKRFEKKDGIFRGKFGIGSGLEYTKHGNEARLRPNGEISVELPVNEYSISFSKRFRAEEGNFYFNITRKF